MWCVCVCVYVCMYVCVCAMYRRSASTAPAGLWRTLSAGAAPATQSAEGPADRFSCSLHKVVGVGWVGGWVLKSTTQKLLQRFVLLNLGSLSLSRSGSHQGQSPVLINIVDAAIAPTNRRARPAVLVGETSNSVTVRDIDVVAVDDDCMTVVVVGAAHTDKPGQNLPQNPASRQPERMPWQSLAQQTHHRGVPSTPGSMRPSRTQIAQGSPSVSCGNVWRVVNDGAGAVVDTAVDRGVAVVVATVAAVVDAVVVVVVVVVVVAAVVVVVVGAPTGGTATSITS
jgi:hypothetical protein